MDRVRAENWLNALLLQEAVVDGWKIESLIGCGKSAAVFRGVKGTQRAAIKLMDPELVERLGKPEQLLRLNLQASLIGKHHPNLVRIFGVGESREVEALYVIMEDLVLPSLHENIANVPREQIFPLLTQVAAAARYLESLGLAHRDIKPENIVVDSEFSHAVLLDLGVLRPHDPEATNGTGLELVGTLRYSPPEFAFSEYEPTPEGYRAITFYQLGAVLHDLIMKQQLFHEYEAPFTRMVEAIRTVTPVIRSSNVDTSLVALARHCLHKDPKVRLRLVGWEDFEAVKQSPNSTDEIRARLQKHRLSATSEIRIPSPATPDDFQSSVKLVMEVARNVCVSSDEYPPIECETVSLGGDSAVLITASRSESLGVTNPFKIRLVVSRLSDDGQAISISGGWMFTSSNDSSAMASAEIFRGIANLDELGPKVENALMRFLLETIEMAQGASSAS